jgi:cation diffusion facilitator family transporter
MSASSSDPARDGRQRLFAARLALVTGVVILLGKLGAYLATSSTAVLSDALESVVNVVAALLLLYSISLAAEPADSNHPYGHGKVEFFSAGIEGAFVLSAALLILVESARALAAGPSVRSLDTGLLLLAALAAANAFLGVHLVRTGEKTRSLALVADGRHVLADVWTSVGVIGGLAAVWATGWVWLDPLIAVGVAIHILREGWSLTRAAVRGLMDASDEEVLGQITGALETDRPQEWIDVHGLRSWSAGALLHADLHLVVPRFLNAEQLHAIHDTIASRIREATGSEGDIVVHFDPCRPRECSSCEMSLCPVREAPSTGRRPIDIARATRSDEAVEASAEVMDAAVAIPTHTGRPRNRFGFKSRA